MDLLNDRNALLGIVFGSVMVLSCAEIPSRSLCTTNTMCGSGYQCNFDTGQCVADGDDTLDEMNSREESQSDGRDDNSDDMQEDTASLPTDNLPVQCPDESSVTDDKGITWVCIEGGSFTMGNDDGPSDEQPAHEVTVPTFWMAKSEVTVGQFFECVKAGDCSTPKTDGDDPKWTYSKLDEQPDWPVTGVADVQVSEFVGYLGDDARLPSEAEWEFAATSRGTQPAPWGDEAIDCSRAQFWSDADDVGCGTDTVTDVCAKAAGTTKEGLCDMLGNVSEWTADVYHGSYDCEANSTEANCSDAGVAPADGSAWTDGRSPLVVHRGGSYRTAEMVISVTARKDVAPDKQSDDIGFRPVRTSAP